MFQRWAVVLALVLALLAGLLGARPARGAANYRVYADSSMAALHGWYNTTNGLWNTTGWWNSANVLTAYVDYSRRTGSSTYRGAIGTTYDRNAAGNFLNTYYDDEGWWALAWINAYDLTADARYLNMAKTIFNDMKGGWSTTCNGGIWWNKTPQYKNAIANELFLSVAIRLHQRTPGDAGAGSFLDWANREWAWFSASGMINANNMVNDGLADGTCVNNGQTTWTYNQGVILAGLADLYKATGTASYLTRAQQIADAAITRLIDANGVLKEPCEPNCGGDGPTFKGVFVRHLAYLNETQPQQRYRDFLAKNADALWQKSRNASNQFGVVWSGPFDTANAANQGSAQDLLNSALTASGPNLALGAAQTTNATCSATEAGAQALDGSTTSKWCAAPTSGQYWLRVDLGASKPVSQFVVKHAGAGGEDAGWNTRDFQIQTSADGATWGTVVTVSGNTASTTLHNITQTTTRYVRLLITNPQTRTDAIAARIYELEVYGSASWIFCANENATCSFTGTRQVRYGADGRYVYRAFSGSVACNNTSFGDPLPGAPKRCDYDSSGGTTAPTPTRTNTATGPTPTRTNTAVGPTPTRTATPPVGTTNLALNKAATADSSCSTTEGPEKAFNGSWTGGTTDKWCSLGASKWLRVDLGANATVSSFTIQHAGAGGENALWNTRDFNLQTSTDGSTWTTVATVTGNTANTTNHPIAARTARYVRLNITTPASDGNGAARVYELQVFGTASTPPTATPAAGTRDPYATVQAESFNAQAGTITENTTDTGAGQNLGAINNGDWLRYDNVNFGTTSPIRVQARVASGAGAGVSGTVEFRLDSTTGTLIGSFAQGPTGGWQTWVTTPANVTGATGTHTLFVVFKSGVPDAFINVNWFVFSRS
jgi:predicted alpha-1,6-mannanase (GH76 family)